MVKKAGKRKATKKATKQTVGERKEALRFVGPKATLRTATTDTRMFNNG